eukprot:81045-Amphidinium_carterae.1
MWLRWNDGSYQPDGQYYQEIVEELRPEFDEQFKPSGGVQRKRHQDDTGGASELRFDARHSHPR